MPIQRCTHCNRRFVYQRYDSDAMHTCDSNSTVLNQEDRWNIAASNATLQGLPNRLGGAMLNTREGGKVYRYTKRGHRAATTLERQFYKYQIVTP